MFKIVFTLSGGARGLVCPPFSRRHAGAKFIPSGYAVLFMLMALTLPLGAEATTVGVYSPARSQFYLTKPGTGAPAPVPIKIKGAGNNWLPLLGAGAFQFGLYDSQTGTFYFRLENSSGPVTKKIRFEGFQPDWLPIAGDWDGDKAYGVGLYDPQTGRFFLKNRLASGPADLTVRLGGIKDNWRPVVGDWNGDGLTTVGAYNPDDGRFHLRNANTDGSAELTLQIQELNTGLWPVAADWDNDGVWSPGLYSQAARTFYWRNTLTTGPWTGSMKLAGVGADALPVTRSISITQPTPAATETGVAAGNGVTATIGANGGTLRSPDQALLLTVPPKALAANTKLTLQPITNHAHCGKGKAYRLLPRGQLFKQPVELTFRYTAKDLHGTAAEELGGAYQTSSGYWRWLDKPVVNVDAKTVTLSTTNFADFAVVENFRLAPGAAKVFVNKTLPLSLQACYPADAEASRPYSLGVLQDSFDAFLPPLSQPQWAVNGIPGGGRTQGAIKGGIYSATYKAPQVKPESNPVAVSTRISPLDSGPGDVLLVSNITIADQVKVYTGTVVYTNHDGQVNARANTIWRQIESPSGSAHYYAATAGNITADIKLDNCDPLRVTVPLENKNLVSELHVYDETHVTTPKAYLFDLWPNWNAMLQMTCYDGNRKPYAYESPASTWLGLSVSSCSVDNPALPRYQDELTLKSSLTCPHPLDFKASWSFKGAILE